MPVFQLAVAGWIFIVGFSILKVRLLAILAGLILLAAWYIIVYRLSGGNCRLAWLAVALIAIDESFIQRATMARPDILAAALAFSGIAAYIVVRARSLQLAAFVSNVFIAVAALTHPNAAMVCLPVLIVTVLLLDRQAISAPLLAYAAFPYLVAAAAYGSYIALDPVGFREQFFSNSAGRLVGFASPFRALLREPLRYVDVESRLAIVRVIPLLIYCTAFVLVAATFKRRGAACKKLIFLAGTAVLALALVDHTKFHSYRIYTIPGLAALAAAAYYDVKQHIPRLVTAGLATALLAVSVGNTARLAIRDWREDLYGGTVAFIRANTPPNVLVMGSSEFFFALGANRVIDDIWLGFYSGVRPDVIVIGPPRDGRTVTDDPDAKPEIARYIRGRLERDFHLAYSNRYYRVYLPGPPT